MAVIALCDDDDDDDDEARCLGGWREKAARCLGGRAEAPSLLLIDSLQPGVPPGGHRQGEVSRWAQFQYDCQPSEPSGSGCKQENYGACLLAYTGLIGSTITPNYLDNSTSNVGPWCSCAASGNHREQCNDFLTFYHDNVCLKNSILSFGNGSDVKTGAGQPGIPSPATDVQSPISTTSAPDVSMEPEQNILRAQIPTQVNENGRLWDDEGDSTPPSPGLSDGGSEPVHPTRLLGLGWLLLLAALLISD
ncbi:unnamed protein product [Pleuronectes platessa]|uniref:GDNF/GAS1 domain-containing protein n=1 Tax=Pleuronectes platessa TaxID=8262 RepID=A0A9N7UYG3_PLEPL|nr:unnamed protein product [Pleuronectes platessa]